MPEPKSLGDEASQTFSGDNLPHALSGLLEASHPFRRRERARVGGPNLGTGDLVAVSPDEPVERLRLAPRRQSATIRPRTLLSKGTSRFSSIIVNQPVSCSDSS